MVVNLDTSLGKGTHWAAIWAKNRSRAFYFDSYGEKPNFVIREYLAKNFRKISYNSKKFQSIFSNVCGAYTIIFIYFMSIGFDFESVMKLFDKTPSSDTFVTEMLGINF